MRRLLQALIVSFLACTASAAENRLNIFNWSEYIDPAVITDFEKRFSCKITMDLYDDAEKMLAKIQAGGLSSYDIVVPPDYMVPTMMKLGLLNPLRKKNIPNFKHLNPKFINREFDRGNRYSVPYMWGTLGILVRPEPGFEITESWGLIFDPNRQPKRFVLIDSLRDCIGATLKHQGQSMNTTNIAHLKNAMNLLSETKSRSRGFSTSLAGANQIRARTVTAAIVYNGDASLAIADDPTLRYVLPKEGTEIWVDNFAITAKAPNRDMAEKFINFILDPVVNARIANFLLYATPNLSAEKYIAPDNFKNPAIYPSKEMMPKLEFLQDLGAASRLYDEVWTRVKSR